MLYGAGTEISLIIRPPGRLGIPPRAFERDHYDVIAERYGAALAAGAEPVDSREIVRRLHAAGLRRRKRSRLADPLPAGEDGPRRKDPM